MKQRGFSPVILLVIVASLIGMGVVGIYLYPGLTRKLLNNQIGTSELVDKSNLDYFIDDQKLISFYYPKGSTNVKSISPSPIGGVSFQAYFNEWLTDPNSWSITVVGVPIADNVEKTKQDIFDTSDLRESKVTNYTEILETTLGGEKAMSYKTESKLPSDTKIISMLTGSVHDNMLYSVGVGISDKTNQEAVKEATKAYDLIRTSFKFLK